MALYSCIVAMSRSVRVVCLNMASFWCCRRVGLQKLKLSPTNCVGPVRAGRCKIDVFHTDDWSEWATIGKNMFLTISRDFILSRYRCHNDVTNIIYCFVLLS